MDEIEDLAGSMDGCRFCVSRCRYYNFVSLTKGYKPAELKFWQAVDSFRKYPEPEYWPQDWQEVVDACRSAVELLGLGYSQEAAYCYFVQNIGMRFNTHMRSQFVQAYQTIMAERLQRLSATEVTAIRDYQVRSMSAQLHRVYQNVCRIHHLDFCWEEQTLDEDMHSLDIYGGRGFYVLHADEPDALVLPKDWEILHRDESWLVVKTKWPAVILSQNNYFCTQEQFLTRLAEHTGIPAPIKQKLCGCLTPASLSD